MKCLNLGCGSRIHPEFVNIDFVSSGPNVQTYDLNRALPFEEEAFDVVYHSHLLEHLQKEKALEFLKECRRVLKTGGIIRVAVPDLQQIARAYLEALNGALRGQAECEANYDWLMLELYDQAVRVRPGGAMREYLKMNRVSDEAFVYRRCGIEARRIVQALRETRLANESQTAGRVNCLRRRAPLVRARLLRMILSENDYRALEIGRFRLRGEVHQWMYDRFSLGRILQRAGFAEPVAMEAHESKIPSWTAYCMDTEPDGTIYKPDSLFMEAVKI